MAYLTFEVSNTKLEKLLEKRIPRIMQQLQRELAKMGVAKDDIVVKVLKCSVAFASEEHLEIILKTNNSKVTSAQIVRILSANLNDIPFEVTRIPVGYWLVEICYEIWAFVTRKRRNWASNYSIIKTQ